VHLSTIIIGDVAKPDLLAQDVMADAIFRDPSRCNERSWVETWVGHSWNGMANYRNHESWALNSAVECHLHTVEVAGSNPAAPTIHRTDLMDLAKLADSA
jgi:hypothetical protein